MFGLTIITTKRCEWLEEAERLYLMQIIKDRNVENLLFKKEREILKLKNKIRELEEKSYVDVLHTAYGDISLKQAENLAKFVNTLKQNDI